MNWLVVLTLPNFFDLPFSSQGDFFLWSLKNMSVSFRVKDQCQAAFNNNNKNKKEEEKEKKDTTTSTTKKQGVNMGRGV